MTRRVLLAMVPGAASAQKRVPVAPTDMALLNDFAALYNVFVEQLGRGLLDAKQWARVSKAWERMTQ